MINWKRCFLIIQLGVFCILPSWGWAGANVFPKLQSLAKLSSDVPDARHLTIEEWQTKAGSKVLFVAAPELPMFDIQLTFAAGSSRDASKPGIALLTNAMLNEGVTGMDVIAIAKTFESVGAVFGNGSYKDMAILTLRSLTDKSKRQIALEMFTKILAEPTFPDSSFKRIKNQILTGFEIEKKTPSHLLNNEFYAKLYGDHPYGHPKDGNVKSINAMTLADLKTFYQQAYNAKNVVIAIVGDLSKQEAIAISDQISNALPKGNVLATTIAPKPAKAGNYHIEFNSQQTHIAMGQLGVRRNDPDFAALYLGNQILGGGTLSSRLMTELRERRGLTYGIYSDFSTMQASGFFKIGLQTRAEMTESSLVLIKKIVQDYLKTGPSEKEVADAKKEITGSFPLTNASNSNIVSQLGAIGFYDLPRDYLVNFVKQIQTLTPEQVKTAMNKHIKMDDFIVVTVGPTVKQLPIPIATENKKSLVGVPEH